MKSSHIKILAVALALTLMAAIAVSQTVKRAHMHGDGMFSEHMLGFFTDYLNLSDAQQSQIKDILYHVPGAPTVIGKFGPVYRRIAARLRPANTAQAMSVSPKRL